MPRYLFKSQRGAIVHTFGLHCLSLNITAFGSPEGWGWGWHLGHSDACQDVDTEGQEVVAQDEEGKNGAGPGSAPRHFYLVTSREPEEGELSPPGTVL